MLEKTWAILGVVHTLPRDRSDDDGARRPIKRRYLR